MASCDGSGPMSHLQNLQQCLRGSSPKQIWDAGLSSTSCGGGIASYDGRKALRVVRWVLQVLSSMKEHCKTAVGESRPSKASAGLCLALSTGLRLAGHAPCLLNTELRDS